MPILIYRRLSAGRSYDRDYPTKVIARHGLHPRPGVTGVYGDAYRYRVIGDSKLSSRVASYSEYRH